MKDTIHKISREIPDYMWTAVEDFLYDSKLIGASRLYRGERWNFYARVSTELIYDGAFYLAEFLNSAVDTQWRRSINYLVTGDTSRWYCKFCGQVHQFGGVHCPTCGAPRWVNETGLLRLCVFCTTPLVDNECTACGGMVTNEFGLH